MSRPKRERQNQTDIKTTVSNVNLNKVLNQSWLQPELATRYVYPTYQLLFFTKNLFYIGQHGLYIFISGKPHGHKCS